MRKCYKSGYWVGRSRIYEKYTHSIYCTFSVFTYLQLLLLAGILMKIINKAVLLLICFIKQENLIEILTFSDFWIPNNYSWKKGLLFQFEWYNTNFWMHASNDLLGFLKTHLLLFQEFVSNSDHGRFAIFKGQYYWVWTTALAISIFTLSMINNY